MVKTIELASTVDGLIDVTDAVATAVAETGTTDGIVLISVPHSTAAVTLMSPHDPLGLVDVHEEICRLIPTRVDFKHEYDTPQDAAAHVKSAIVGHSRSIYLTDGRLGLGPSQRIFFWEFDPPRRRIVHVQVVPTRPEHWDPPAMTEEL